MPTQVKKGKKCIVIKVKGISIIKRSPRLYVIQIRKKNFELYESFKTLDEARVRCKQIHLERQNYGLNAFNLTPQMRADAQKAVDRLGGRATLEECSLFWIQHHPDQCAVLVNDIIKSYLEDLDRKRRRKSTQMDAAARLSRFAKTYGNTPIAQITDDQLQKWLDDNGRSARNTINHRRQVRALFNYAMRKKIIGHNPTIFLSIPSTDPSPPVHWPTDRVKALMDAAAHFKPDMVPMLAIMAFAGLRPEEAARLDWQNVILGERIIQVTAGISKMRRARNVEDLADNLVAWLEPYSKKSGRLAPAKMTIDRWRPRLSAACVLGIDEVQRRMEQHKGKKGTQIKSERLGWSAIVEDAKKRDTLWHPDILRHTFATYWMATHSDINRLSELLGNSPNVIKTHYQGMSSKKEAALYWAIMPTPEAAKVRDVPKRPKEKFRGIDVPELLDCDDREEVEVIRPAVAQKADDSLKGKRHK